MPKKNQPPYFTLTLVGVLPIILLLIIFSIRFVSFESYRQLVSEDGILETLQFLFYFLTGCVLLNTLRVLLKEKAMWIMKSVLFVLAGVFIFMSFEEISWGERILQYRNPDFFTVYNVQQEVSVHNLVFVQPYLHSFYIFLGLFLGLGVPFLSQLERFKKYRYYFYDWNMLFYFIPLSAVYLLLVIEEPISISGLSAYGLIWRDQEVAETLLALGVLVWSMKANFFSKTKV